MVSLAGASFFNQSPILQNKYRSRLRSQVHTRTRIWNMIPTMDNLTGSKLVGLLQIGLPGGGGARGPGGPQLPIAVRTPHKNYRVVATYQYFKIKADWDLEEQTKGNSWMRAFAIEQEAIQKRIKQHMERQSCRDGTAFLGEVASVSGATVTLTSEWDTVAFYPGTRIDGYDALDENGTSQLTGFLSEADYPVVVSVNANGPTVTFDKVPTGLAMGHFIIIYGSFSGGTGNGDLLTNEMYGIDTFIDDGAPPLQQFSNEPAGPAGTLQGIDPTENGFWQSQIVDAGNGSFRAEFVENGVYRVQVFGAESSDGLTYIYCHPKQEQVFFNNNRSGFLQTGDTQAPLVRYPTTSSGGVAMDPSWRGLKSERDYLRFGNMVFLTSKYFDTRTAYICHSNCVGKIQVYDWSYVPDPSGGVIHKSYNNDAAWEADLMYIGALATELRNGSIRIENLEDIT